MSGNKIHFALIGAGAMGKRWADTISKQASLDMVVDIEIEKAKELVQHFKGCRASSKMTDVLNDPSISSTVVVVPHRYLADISYECLKKGKNVLSEKPGAVGSALIKRNIKLAKTKKLVYMVGFNYRFHQAFLKCRKLFEKGLIGNILFIRARHGFGGRKGYEKEWRLSKKVSGGGELIDQGVHMIDMIISYLGVPDSVLGFAEDSFWKSGSDDNAFLLLKSKHTIGSMHVSLTQWNALHNFEIYGTKGYLSVEGLGKKYGGKEVLKIGLRSGDFTQKPKEKVFECDADANKSLKLELKEFVSAIKEKRDAIPGPEGAYQTMKVVEKIYRK